MFAGGGDSGTPPGRSAADLAMDRYAAGDDAAFEVVYDALARPLLRFARGQVRSEAAAEDVAQQTFLQMIKNRAQWVMGSRALPWAYAIARNLIRDYLRKIGPTVPSKGEGDDPGVEEIALLPSGAQPADEALSRRERERSLEEELRHLPEKLRAAFILVKSEGLSIRDAATILGISEANVKVRAHRAAELLRRSDRKKH